MTDLDNSGPFIAYALFASDPSPDSPTITIAGETFLVTSWPAKLPSLLVGIQGGGHHQLQVVIRREDNSEIHRTTMEADGIEPPRTLRIEMRNPAVIDRPGLYAIDLESGGGLLTRVLFRVLDRPSAGFTH